MGRNGGLLGRDIREGPVGVGARCLLEVDGQRAASHLGLGKDELLGQGGVVLVGDGQGEGLGIGLAGVGRVGIGGDDTRAVVGNGPVAGRARHGVARGARVEGHRRGLGLGGAVVIGIPGKGFGIHHKARLRIGFGERNQLEVIVRELGRITINVAFDFDILSVVVGILLIQIENQLAGDGFAAALGARHLDIGGGVVARPLEGRGDGRGDAVVVQVGRGAMVNGIALGDGREGAAAIGGIGSMDFQDSIKVRHGGAADRDEVSDRHAALIKEHLARGIADDGVTARHRIDQEVLHQVVGAFARGEDLGNGRRRDRNISLLGDGQRDRLGNALSGDAERNRLFDRLGVGLERNGDGPVQNDDIASQAVGAGNDTDGRLFGHIGVLGVGKQDRGRIGRDGLLGLSEGDDRIGVDLDHGPGIEVDGDHGGRAVAAEDRWIVTRVELHHVAVRGLRRYDGIVLTFLEHRPIGVRIRLVPAFQLVSAGRSRIEVLAAGILNGVEALVIPVVHQGEGHLAVGKIRIFAGDGRPVCGKGEGGTLEVVAGIILLGGIILSAGNQPIPAVIHDHHIARDILVADGQVNDVDLAGLQDHVGRSGNRTLDGAGSIVGLRLDLELNLRSGGNGHGIDHQPDGIETVAFPDGNHFGGIDDRLDIRIENRPVLDGPLVIETDPARQGQGRKGHLQAGDRLVLGLARIRGVEVDPQKGHGPLQCNVFQHQGFFLNLRRIRRPDQEVAGRIEGAERRMLGGLQVQAERPVITLCKGGSRIEDQGLRGPVGGGYVPGENRVVVGRGLSLERGGPVTVGQRAENQADGLTAVVPAGRVLSGSVLADESLGERVFRCAGNAHMKGLGLLGSGGFVLLAGEGGKGEGGRRDESEHLFHTAVHFSRLHRNSRSRRFRGPDQGLHHRPVRK